MLHVRSLLLAIAFLVPSLTAVAFADGPAYQVADIAPNEPAPSEGGTFYPSFFQPVANGDVFLAPAGTGPASVWRTDGTPGGTKPIAAGAALGYGRLVGSDGERAYFAAQGSSGRTTAVWVTDGTAAGTVLLKGALGGGGFFGGSDIWVVDGRVFFHDCHPAPGGRCDLWTSAGTPETTQKIGELGELVSSYSGIAGSAGKYYFFASPPDDPRPALWRTDGSAPGTVRLRSFDFSPTVTDVVSVSGRAVATAEQKLWVVDGNSVELARSFGAEEYFSFFDARVIGGRAYFVSQPANGGTTFKVWRSDGTVGGTASVLSSTVIYSPVMADSWVEEHAGRVYYLVPSQQGGAPYTLWSSGTGIAQPVSCAVCASVPEPGWISKVGNQLLFPGASADVHSLWAIDASHVPRTVATYCGGSCRTSSPVVANGKVFFWVAYDEVWASDGTAAGTARIGLFRVAIASLYASSNLGAALFGASEDLFTRPNLWLSRGTPQSTVALTVVEGAGSQPRELRRAGSGLAFLACGEQHGMWGAGAHAAELLKEGYVDCSGSTDTFHPFVSGANHAFFEHSEFTSLVELWATAGNQPSTTKVLDVGAEIYDMAAFQGGVAFWVYQGSGGWRLWRSDGTIAGTNPALYLPAEAFAPSGTTEVSGELYFRANSPESQVWRTDGTAAGLRRLTDIAGGEFLTDLGFTRLGAYVFFAGKSGIWRTDGTAAGTTLAVPAPPNVAVDWLHEQGGALLFRRTESSGASTLWRTVGTPATTQQVAAFAPFSEFWPSVASFGGPLYFAADDGVHGVELWRTDGTTAGTVLVRDIGVGPTSGNPRYLTTAHGRLYFTADDAVAGSELWVSDGTSAGTRLVQDIAPDAASSAPAELTVVGDLLYFSADDGSTGRELWALPLTAPEPCAAGEQRLCLEGGRFQVEVTWRDFAARTGSGHAVPLTGDTGYFWFFDPANVELTIKVLDGTGLNGHHWVFYGALSSVEYTVTVTDTRTGQVKRYVNPSGTFASVGDTSAFAEGVAGTAAPAAGGRTSAVGRHTAIVSVASASATTVPPSPCVPSASRLCLQGGRFAVDAAWTDFAGNSGGGTAVTLTGDTGYFWFFGPSNVEVVIKVLDGRPVNQKFWVFYGALSNVEYTLTVTDTMTGVQRQYHNPSGRFASAGDTSAF